MIVYDVNSSYSFERCIISRVTRIMIGPYGLIYLPIVGTL